jgi:uncharacterized phiE125 gp8 family phage protein
MTLRLITAPGSEPISLAEAKTHLRVTHSLEDALITSLITAAREMCEQKIGRSLIQTTWEVVLDCFPDEIRLDMPPILAVASLKYIDANGTLQTWGAGNYYVDKDREPGWVLPAFGVSWPDTREQANAVRVQYTAGYGVDATTVPVALKSWILVTIGTLYENRESLITGTIVHKPTFFDSLLDAYRVPRL